jgi:hypothetical protein
MEATPAIVPVSMKVSLDSELAWEMHSFLN